MKKSDSITKLAAALTKAQAELTPVEFDSKNPFFKSRYASLGAVISMSRPILAKHGLSIVQLPASDTAGRIGIENVIMHDSGEWMSGELLLTPEPEKGRSASQTIGAAITYFRRYCWSSSLGIYADEDTDGNGPAPGADSPSGRFEDLPPSRPTTQGPTRQPEAKPATAASPPAANATPGDPPVIAELRKKMGPAAKSFVWFLRHYDSGNGTPVLPPPKGFAEIPLDWAKHFVDSFDETVAKMDAFLINNPMPEPESAGPPKPVEVPRDPQPATPDAWREFLMPFGEQKGTPLSKLDKKYLFGLWANYTVQKEYKGKPNPPERIEADTKFRKMLDDAGLHYGFK